MIFFRPDNRGAWPRADVHRIHERIAASFSRSGGGMPRVSAIASAGYAHDDHLYETFFELGPGVIASATWDLSEEEKEELRVAPWNPAARNVASVAAAAADVARHYMALGTDHLADLLHDLRIRARRRLANLAATGGGPRLVSLRLTGGDWLHSDEFKVILRLECLDRFLFSDIVEREFDDLGEIEEELDHWGRHMAKSYALRLALAGEGATGTIDLVTLNALAMFGNVVSTLRALDRGIMPWGSNHLDLFGEDGNLWSRGSDPASGLSWNANSIAHPTVLPASVLMAYAGRPVTDLITHQLLTPSMTIVEASRDPKTGTLKVDLEQPRWLFCHHSGRAWQGPPASEFPQLLTGRDRPPTGDER